MVNMIGAISTTSQINVELLMLRFFFFENEKVYLKRHMVDSLWEQVEIKVYQFTI